MHFIEHILAVLIMGAMAAALIYFSAPRQTQDPFWASWDGTPIFDLDSIGLDDPPLSITNGARTSVRESEGCTD